MSAALNEFRDLMEKIVPGRVHLSYAMATAKTEITYDLLDAHGHLNKKVPLTFDGLIHGRCGPMFSEKSHWLISSVDKARKAGRIVAPMKPATDTRDKGLYTRHGGGKAIECDLLKEGELTSAIDKMIRNKVQVVVIDELHFLANAYAFCSLLQALGMEVFVAFLDGTFMQRAFPSVSDLFTLMYDYEKTLTYCYRCPYATPGQHATCTIKFRSDDGEELRQSSDSVEDDKVAHVGGEECYIAVCRRCSMQYHLGNRRYESLNT